MRASYIKNFTQPNVPTKRCGERSDGYLWLHSEGVLMYSLLTRCVYRHASLFSHSLADFGHSEVNRFLTTLRIVGDGVRRQAIVLSSIFEHGN